MSSRVLQGSRARHSRQATAAWQWLNFLEARAPPGKKIVHINMDETSLKFYPAQARAGSIATFPGERLSDMRSRPCQASLSARRRAVTLVAFVADDCEVQRVLPQIIAGCTNNIPATWAASQRRRADCVYVCRQGSGWLNTNMFNKVLKLLGASLRPLAETRFFILSMDAAPVHMTASAARASHRAGVMPHLLPARTTSLLQPLDRLVLARLKRCIGQDYETACLMSATTTLSLSTTLDIFSKVANDVLTQGDHQNAFLKCGIGGKQQHICRSLLRYLDVDAAPTICSDLPSLEQLQFVYAAKKSIPIMALFSPWIRVPGATALQTADSDGSEDDAPEVPLRQRLRSWARSREPGRQAQSTPAAASSAAASTPTVSRASEATATRRRVPTAVRLW